MSCNLFELQPGRHNFVPAVAYLESMMIILRSVFAIYFATAFLTASAQQRLSRTELTTVTTELTASVEELRARSETLQVQNADLALQVRDLEAENAQLTGRIETLQFQLGQSRDEISALQADNQDIGRLLTRMTDKIEELEARLADQEHTLDTSHTSGDANGNPVGLVLSENGLSVEADVGNGADSDAESSVEAEETALALPSDLPREAEPLFADAKARLLRFDYEGAERSFRAYLALHSETEQAGEAQYWLGEVLYQQKSYAASGQAYSDMIRNYPEDARAPDALVKLGRSLRLVGEEERACAVLETLAARYPDASPVTRNLAEVERSRSACGS